LWAAAGGDAATRLIEPPRVGTASHGVLVPQVDADGNNIAGICSVFVQALSGTYTGWNVGRAGHSRAGCAICRVASSPSRTTARSAIRPGTAPVARRALSGQIRPCDGVPGCRRPVDDAAFPVAGRRQGTGRRRRARRDRIGSVGRIGAGGREMALSDWPCRILFSFD